MKLTLTPRLKAILQALLVTFLWATSWVLIKIGLVDVPAVLFAGLRYGLAALCLLVFWLFSRERNLLREVDGRGWIKVVLIGLFCYAAMQSAQFLGLRDLPATSVNLIFGMSTIVIALLGTIFIGEPLSFLQWAGVLLTPVGAYLYFFPITIRTDQTTSLLIVIGGAILGAIGSIISRDVNRSAYLPPLTLTTFSILIGSAVMFAVGIATEGFPAFSITSWLIIIWMAVVNTAFAFTLFNRTMQVLQATETAAINNTLMIQVPILAFVFLGERISLREILGLCLVLTGVIMVQLFRKKVKPTGDKAPDF
jgi:drug/metabolite transporter (DMT)-like permease